MQRTFGAPEVREVCLYKPVDINIDDLFKLNWDHWKVGFIRNKHELDNPQYYIYSILGGIILLRFNEENRKAVKEYVEKQRDPETGQTTRYNEAYLAWYDITHDIKHPKYNVAKEVKIPNLRIDAKRIAKTINKELADPKSLYPGVKFSDICAKFVEDAKEAVTRNNPELIRESHNKFTSFIMNHIILVPCHEKMFAYDKRDVKRTNQDGSPAPSVLKDCNEIHFIVTHEVQIGGSVNTDLKTMPTLPIITGGGKRRSSWTIENILMKGKINGLVETVIVPK